MTQPRTRCATWHVSLFDTHSKGFIMTSLLETVSWLQTLHVTIFYSLKNSNGICWQILIRIFIIAYTLTTLCHCSIWDLKKKTKKQQECYKRNSFFKRLVLLVLLLSLKLTFEIPATLLICVSTIMNSQNVFGESWSPVIRWAWIEFLTSHRHINVRQQLIRFQTHNCASVVLKIIIVRATTVSCMSKL